MMEEAGRRLAPAPLAEAVVALKALGELGGEVARDWIEKVRGDMTLDDRARIFEDERRVFSAQTPAFSFRCRETLVHGAAPGPAAVFRFLARKPGLSPEAFEARWRQGHAPIAVRAAEAAGSVTRHAHNRLIAPPPPARAG
jgi:hypothetical protein